MVCTSPTTEEYLSNSSLLVPTERERERESRSDE